MRLRHLRRHDRPAIAILAAVAVLLVVPGPAGAALLAEFRTVVTSVQPTAPGVSAKAAENGESITVTNTSDKPLLIEGYQHEIYLKITDHGVWRNKVSPATYLNKEQTIGTLPSQASANKPPVWVKIDAGSTTTWHDHRIHWMGSQDPAVTQADPHHSHVINHWTIPTQYAGKKGAIKGTLTWYPGTRWGLDAVYAAIALAIIATIVVVAVVGRRRRAAKAAASTKDES